MGLIIFSFFELSHFQFLSCITFWVFESLCFWLLSHYKFLVLSHFEFCHILSVKILSHLSSLREVALDLGVQWIQPQILSKLTNKIELRSWPAFSGTWSKEHLWKCSSRYEAKSLQCAIFLPLDWVDLTWKWRIKTCLANLLIPI